MADDYEHALALWWAGRTQDEREMVSQQAINRNDRRSIDYLTKRENIEWAFATHKMLGPRMRGALGRRFRSLCEANGHG
jgi:hypothetical protein